MVHGSYIFFFKQKTAYEMRISDWSSDVCSSDLKEAWTRPAGLAPDASVALWPDRYLTAPEGLTERVVQRSDDPQASDRMLEHIVRPRLDIFRPANPHGAAMILAPGGGHRYVLIDQGGHDLAQSGERGVGEECVSTWR